MERMDAKQSISARLGQRECFSARLNEQRTVRGLSSVVNHTGRWLDPHHRPYAGLELGEPVTRSAADLDDIGRAIVADEVPQRFANPLVPIRAVSTVVRRR